MRRRTFLAVAAGSLVAVFGVGAAALTQMPVVPGQPVPDGTTAAGWISFRDGRYTLTLPRAEMGQNIATALKQIACAELGADWEDVDVVFHDTSIPDVRSTVGSESIMMFAKPLAEACAALREAVAARRTDGVVDVKERAFAELQAFRPNGQSGLRPELVHGRDIVTGKALYAGDVRRPGMLFGRVLRAPAPIERASRPLRWNLEAARSVPGFVSVVEETGPAIGEAVGLGILANRPGALDRIAEALDIEWEISGETSVKHSMDVIDIDRRLAEGDLPHTELDGAPTDGAWDVDLRIDIAMAAHGAIEPRVAVAEWLDETLSVWAGTQDAFFVRNVLADVFEIAAEDITVQTCRIGGAFGGKMFSTVEVEAAALARAAGRPVKVQWTRAQEYAQTFHRPPTSHRVKARLSDGKITDWNHAQVSSHVIFTAAILPKWLQTGTDYFVGDEGVARGMDIPYAVPQARATYDVVALPVHTGPWRGLGAGPNGLVVESAIDELAAASGEDPLAFRLAHIKDPRLTKVLERVAEVSSWGKADPTSAAGKRTGRGIACGIYNKVSYAAVVADVAVDAGGTVEVTRLWCAHECGTVINPDQVRAQCEGNLVWSLGLVLSDDLGVEDGRVAAETFSDAPIPTNAQVPEITVDLVLSDNAPTGAGETAMIAAPGAIANAVRAATGVRPARFPIRGTDLTA